MKAAYFINGAVEAGDLPDPVPGKGHALVRTHSRRMCASEANFSHAGQSVIDLSKQCGGPYAAMTEPLAPGRTVVDPRKL